MSSTTSRPVDLAMPNGYTYAHMEWLARRAYHDAPQPTEFEILLYNDRVDHIELTDDLVDITTEPQDGNYSRVVLEFPGDLTISASKSEGYLDIRPSAAVEFDFENVTGTVDMAGIVWEATISSDDQTYGPFPHLMARCELDERYDLAEMSRQYELDPGWQLHTLF